MLKIAICEDNAVHAEIIHNLVKENLAIEYETSIFSSSAQFLKSLPEFSCPYDLVLMDIELGRNSLSGISLAEKINLRNPNVQIIYISQYLKYISAVYETKHVYFVNKEQLTEYLPKALHLALENLAALQNQFLYFSKNQEQFQVVQTDILYMERILRTTEIHTRTETYSTAEKLSSLMTQLSSAFCLCHRSYLVNLKAITSFNRNEINFLNGQKIPVARSYYENVKKSFAQLML